MDIDMGSMMILNTEAYTNCTILVHTDFIIHQKSLEILKFFILFFLFHVIGVNLVSQKLSLVFISLINFLIRFLY